MRQAITQRVIRMAIAATARVPAGTQSAVARRAVLLGGGIPVLRRKVLANMRLALGGDVPDEAARLYFEHAGWFLANALATFHHGVERTPVIGDVDLGPTVSVLDEAMAEGRGVVLATPHWSGHELIGGVIARRHPMVMLVRQTSAAERAARKLHWYRALGAQTVVRPEHASAINDAAAYLKALKQRKVLGITPDLLASPGQGVGISLFGRSARVYGGAFAFAIATGAPLIRFYLTWQPDEKVTLTFEKAPPPPFGASRDAAIQASTQEWFRWFEDRSTDQSGELAVLARSPLEPVSDRDAAVGAGRMNILIVIAVAAFALCLLWLVQSIALKLAGEPLALPLRFDTRKPLVKWTSRVMIHVAWIIVIVGTPLALGISPIEWLHRQFPLPVPWRDIGSAVAVTLVPIWAMYAVWLMAGWVRIEPRFDRATRRAKLLRRIVGPWPLAALEEAVFRGVLLDQLLRTLPQGTCLFGDRHRPDVRGVRVLALRQEVAGRDSARSGSRPMACSS